MLRPTVGESITGTRAEATKGWTPQNKEQEKIMRVVNGTKRTKSDIESMAAAITDQTCLSWGKPPASLSECSPIPNEGETWSTRDPKSTYLTWQEFMSGRLNKSEVCCNPGSFFGYLQTCVPTTTHGIEWLKPTSLGGQLAKNGHYIKCPVKDPATGVVRMEIMRFKGEYLYVSKRPRSLSEVGLDALEGIPGFSLTNFKVQS